MTMSKYWISTMIQLYVLPCDSLSLAQERLKRFVHKISSGKTSHNHRLIDRRLNNRQTVEWSIYSINIIERWILDTGLPFLACISMQRRCLNAFQQENFKLRQKLAIWLSPSPLFLVSLGNCFLWNVKKRIPILISVISLAWKMDSFVGVPVLCPVSTT